MTEDQNWEEANNHTLCANNCGFFGSPTMHNLCSKCFNDHCLKQKQLSTAKIAVEKSLLSSLSQPPETETETCSISSTVDTTPAIISTDAIVLDSAPEMGVKSQPRNRCGSCRRRVGLTGFTCKCRTTFCGIHRYPEKHGCTFDYKTMGKEAIAKANPVVKGVKLEKI